MDDVDRGERRRSDGMREELVINPSRYPVQVQIPENSLLIIIVMLVVLMVRVGRGRQIGGDRLPEHGHDFVG